MINQYTIFSIDDERINTKQNLRNALSIKEVFVDCVNGNNHNELESAKEKWNIKITSPFKRGEYGIWYTTLNAWEYAGATEDLLTYEDDALPTLYCEGLLDKYLVNMPNNIDFISLFVPDNQKPDYMYDVVYNNEGVPSWNGNVSGQSKFDVGHPFLCRAYQTYSNVSVIYTKRGAQRLIKRARQTGINQPVDCWLYAQSHAGYINGYALKPSNCNIVDYQWNNKTTIHNSEYIHMEDEKYR